MPVGDKSEPQGLSGKDRQVRVFISSTFRDMHAERDHLVTVVFPELRERVEQLGLEFFDVDLRWGVPAKTLDGETANSWEYCRQWIDRVEPFFVCILGQRYGWVPKVEDFKSAEEKARQASEPRSITDLEVRHAVLNDRRKRRSYFYLRETLVPELPPNATVEERKLYAEFVDPEPEAGKLTALKNDVKQCKRPARGYDCRWTGKEFADLDKAEKKFGPMVLEDLWSGVLRDERYVSKDVWRQVLGGDPDSDPRYTDESEPVPRQLWEEIVALARPAPVSPLDAERQQMDAFAASRLRWFQGRTCELQQLTDFIQSTAADAPHLAVVAAVPGQGKSALLAKLSTLNPQPSTFQITHFVGATERSATAHALVERLLGELDRSGIQWPADERKEGEEPKRDFNSLCERLRKRLGDYAGESRVVILLDALNQLTDGHDLHWLPVRLGPSVRVVVSCVDDSLTRPGGHPLPSDGRGAGGEGSTLEQRVLHALASRQPVPLRVPLGPLTEGDVRTIVVEYLKEYCKELDQEHVDAICHMGQAKNPLYLLVMLGELRTLGGNDMNRIVGERIAALPRDYPDTVSLFRWVLQRLEVFGSEAVRWWCLYLAHGRVGMASHELADLLARKLGANAAATALLIERGLRRYLLRRGGQLDFFHGQLRQAVMEQYGSQPETTVVHREMADYFIACAKGTDPQKEWETDSVRGFAECVFHLTKAGQHEQAAGLLTNFPFLLHKLQAGLLEGVFEDYDLVRRKAPAEMARRLEIWADFFREKAHILRRGNDEWPAHKILLQLTVEHADDSPLTIAAEQWLAEGRCGWLWLRRVSRLPRVQKNPCLAVLEGHTQLVEGALALANGRLLSWSSDGSLRLWSGHSGAYVAILEGHTQSVLGALALADGRLLSWSSDRTLRSWDVHSHACLAVLKGHSSPIRGALALADGRVLSWARHDMTLRLWHGQSGTCLANLSGHTGWVNGALALSNGRLLSWSDDRTLRVWDGQSGACLAVLSGHTGGVQGAMELANRQLLSWSHDKMLRVWDGQSGACLATFEGHTGAIVGALKSSDGQLLSWAMDGTLRMWSSQSGACLVVLEGHTGYINGALELSDGRLLSWSGRMSDDKTLRIWDTQGGVCLAVLQGHTDCIEGALALADGRLLSWSSDRSLRLWDGQSGACLAVLEGHTEGVLGALALPDGRLLSWSFDGTLRMWDSRSGACSVVSGGHTGMVAGALALTEARLLSWASDKTLRLWDSQSGACLAVLEGEHLVGFGGHLALASGRLLSWLNGSCLNDKPQLRVWDGQSGTCLAVLEGHTEGILGALAIADGRLLSWAVDCTLRLWDSQSGACLAVLKGHTGEVWGALALADGRLLSWALDKTLRLWDSKNGACVAVLLGHTESVRSVLALADGRLLSWSRDKTLRLWDGQSGACLVVLEGHTAGVEGALKLGNGRLLSWSEDKTLRLWDGKSGACLAVLEGHTGEIAGGLELADGRLLSWSWYNTLWVWDSESGACLEVVQADQVSGRHPEWLHALEKVRNPRCVFRDFFVDSTARTAHLRHRVVSPLLAAWNAGSDASARCLLADGTVVVTQANFQVCILKLLHGQCRVSLAEAEELLRNGGSQKPEVRGQKADTSAEAEALPPQLRTNP